MATKFIAKPKVSAGGQEVQTHFMYTHVLGQLTSTELFKSSLRQCSFGTEIDLSFDLRFELFSLNENVHDECSFSRCAALLTDLLQSIEIDDRMFSRAINSVVKAARAQDAADLRSPSMSAKRAAAEAYRYIYPLGTKERSVFDTSPEDFLKIEFASFAAWLKSQQDTLRRSLGSKEMSPGSSAAIGGRSIAMQTDSDNCVTNNNLDIPIQELTIERQGWGHQSIMLVRNGYKREGIAGIENAQLRAVCHPGAETMDVSSPPPLAEMADRMRCLRERQDDRIRWLVLFSKHAPAITGVEMRRYAEAIARALKGEKCRDPDLQIFVANFLPHN